MTNIAIIGAGITGALIADALLVTGRRVVMLDQREPALGSTAASTALLQYEIDTHLSDLLKKLDASRATLAYQACVQSFSLLEKRFPEVLGQCDYQRTSSLYLAANARDLDTLRAELAARRAIGIQAEWLEGEQLRSRYGCQRPGAILSALASSFDPVRFTRGVLSACIRHGMRVFARTTVESIEDVEGGLRLRTAGGHEIRSQHVVVAAGYESMRFLPRGLEHHVADISNTFALVTEPVMEPLAAGLPVAALPLIWETARPYLYLRATRDGRLLLGGGDVPFRNSLAREALLPRQIHKLASAFQELFGHALPPIAHTWAGSFAATRDGLPYIGAAPGGNPRLQFALCFGGNGITYAVHAGDMVRAAIEGRTHALEAVFGFGRIATERLIQSGSNKLSG